MATLAALAASSTAGSVMPARQSVSARATLQIVSSVRLRVGASRAEGGQPVRTAAIRGQDGSRQLARLVEFE